VALRDRERHIAVERQEDNWRLLCGRAIEDIGWVHLFELCPSAGEWMPPSSAPAPVIVEQEQRQRPESVLLDIQANGRRDSGLCSMVTVETSVSDHQKVRSRRIRRQGGKCAGE